MKCEICGRFKEQISNPNLTREEKKQARQKFDVHLQLIQNERRLMHQRMKQCMSDAKRMLIYLDTMDQDKTDIPRLQHMNVKEGHTALKVRFFFLFFFSSQSCS